MDALCLKSGFLCLLQSESTGAGRQCCSLVSRCAAADVKPEHPQLQPGGGQGEPGLGRWVLLQCPAQEEGFQKQVA